MSDPDLLILDLFLIMPPPMVAGQGPWSFVRLSAREAAAASSGPVLRGRIKDHFMPPSTSRMPRFLAVADVADLLKVSTRTVRRWIERGELHAHCIRGRFRIDEADLRLFLALSRR